MLKFATMGKICTRLLIFLTACAVGFGCETLEPNAPSRSPNKGDASPVKATWWNGPCVRPGVALIVQIGTLAQPQIFNVMVDQNGEIVIPYLLQKPVACDGLTLEALKQKLVKEYSVYIRQPQVSVTFAPYDGKGVSPWGTITVLGEVMMPGPVNIPSTMNLTVTKALQMAGGAKQYADNTRILVTHCEKDGRQVMTRIDLEEIGKGGRPDKDMMLRAGDVVWVPQTWY